MLSDTFQRGQDQHCSSKHLILLLPAHIKGLSGICWRVWDWVSRWKVTLSRGKWEGALSLPPSQVRKVHKPGHLEDRGSLSVPDCPVHLSFWSLDF